MKYVILRNPQTGLDMPVLGCSPTTHAELAAAFAPRRPVAAGFVEWVGGGALRTFGRSESLRLEPGPRDAALLAALHHGTVAMARGVDAEVRATVARGPRELTPALREEIAHAVAGLRAGA